MSVVPLKIRVKDKQILHISWDDNSETSIPLKTLRENCPCAICLDEKLHRPAKYIPLLSKPQTEVENIEMVGTYAIRIYWKDGHNTGIFNFEKLKSL
jgi:DUF971 family protein